jgi:hypothetical protein
MSFTQNVLWQLFFVLPLQHHREVDHEGLGVPHSHLARTSGYHIHPKIKAHLEVVLPQVVRRGKLGSFKMMVGK